jgi:hypothetical protein
VGQLPDSESPTAQPAEADPVAATADG